MSHIRSWLMSLLSITSAHQILLSHPSNIHYGSSTCSCNSNKMSLWMTTEFRTQKQITAQFPYTSKHMGNSRDSPDMSSDMSKCPAKNSWWIQSYVQQKTSNVWRSPKSFRITVLVLVPCSPCSSTHTTIEGFGHWGIQLFLIEHICHIDRMRHNIWNILWGTHNILYIL